MAVNVTKTLSERIRTHKTPIMKVASEDGTRIAVKDYVAGMTDRYAISLYSELFVPRGWTDFK